MKKRKRTSFRWAYKAEEALRRAVAEAIAEHRRNGVPIAILRNGKVVRIPGSVKRLILPLMCRLIWKRQVR